ncbi:MAG: glycosyltransferase involved in cell wall biosynthesis [Paracoccaceae bacterium]|jgi:glycosyltransferase involved in cell wall biosynthesis
MISKLRAGLFLSLWRKCAAHCRQYGLRATVKKIALKVLRRETTPVMDQGILEFYQFVRVQPVGFPVKAGDCAQNTINWFIPPFGFGSGGHLNIFRFVKMLECDGFECRIIIVGDVQGRTAGELKGLINEWFFPLESQVYIDTATAPAAHISMATSWQTAYYLRDFQATVHRCYFVQDFEPLFYSAGSECAWAENTYRFGFTGITAGGWLKEKLEREYGMQTHAFGFSFDRKLYGLQDLQRKNAGGKKVFFYARPPTQRRAFEMGVMALHKLSELIPEVEVVFAGWDVAGYQIPFKHQNMGTLALEQLPELYRECDAALVLSFTNLSLLPLELMASGVPVVSNRGACVEWLLNDSNSRLCEPTIESISLALYEVLSSTAESDRLRSAGLELAEATDWEREGGKVATVLRSLG